MVMAWEMLNSSYLDIQHWQHSILPFVVLAPDLGPSLLLAVLLVVHGLMFRLPWPCPVPAVGDPMQHVLDSLSWPCNMLIWPIKQQTYFPLLCKTMLHI